MALVSPWRGVTPNHPGPGQWGVQTERFLSWSGWRKCASLPPFLQLGQLMAQGPILANFPVARQLCPWGCVCALHPAVVVGKRWMGLGPWQKKLQAVWTWLVYMAHCQGGISDSNRKKWTHTFVIVLSFYAGAVI